MNAYLKEEKNFLEWGKAQIGNIYIEKRTQQYTLHSVLIKSNTIRWNVESKVFYNDKGVERKSYLNETCYAS